MPKVVGQNCESRDQGQRCSHVVSALGQVDHLLLRRNLLSAFVMVLIMNFPSLE